MPIVVRDNKRIIFRIEIKMLSKILFIFYEIQNKYCLY
jgi:hypothetical protein